MANMTVREVIDDLLKMNPDAEVKFCTSPNDEFDVASLYQPSEDDSVVWFDLYEVDPRMSGAAVYITGANGYEPGHGVIVGQPDDTMESSRYGIKRPDGRIECLLPNEFRVAS